MGTAETVPSPSLSLSPSPDSPAPGAAGEVPAPLFPASPVPDAAGQGPAPQAPDAAGQGPAPLSPASQAPGAAGNGVSLAQMAEMEREAKMKEEEMEDERAAADYEVMLLMLRRMEKEGHGVMRWLYNQNVFFVSLERLYKERINREVLMQLLRRCVNIMMHWIPEFRGVVVDVVCERKYMLENTQDRFTQKRMPSHVIRWFRYRLPNKCRVIVQEKLRDLGVMTQNPYKPSEVVLHHCFGGDELRVVKWGFERFAVGKAK